MTRPLDEVFYEATGVRLLDFPILATALWAGCMDQRPIVNYPTYLSALGWDGDRIERLLALVSLPFDEYRRRIREEIGEHSLSWYFTTFARFPIVRFDDDLLVLDPELLLRRCLGFVLFFDIQEGLIGLGRNSEVIGVKRAFDDYSERYVREALESLSGGTPLRRVYSDRNLRAAYKDQKISDVVVDYGDAWVVVEVTTRRATRDTVNAVSVDGLIRDRNAIIEEAMQVASTIDLIRRDEARLTGLTRPSGAMFFPVVVLTEGFPVNPLTTSLIRDELARQNILDSPDIAQLEIMDVVELDMIEGVAEGGGPALPEILRVKAASNFRADSVRNFLVGSPRFAPSRPRRVTELFRRLFGSIATELGGDPRLFE